MFSSRMALSRRKKDDGEKPFWISFSDLMTALMMLFLVTMSVALLAVTKTVSESERKKAQREQDIEKLLTRVEIAAKEYGVTVDRSRNVIDFGDRAQFKKESHKLMPEQTKLLRAFVPRVVLPVARDELGKRWLKRLVVEGFASRTGNYLYNLNLSMQRSQRVLCVLLAKPFADEQAMESSELEQIRALFLVGGYSFNSAKASLNASQRIEIRLEFFLVDEKPLPTEVIPLDNFGECALDS